MTQPAPDSPLIAPEGANNCPPREVGPQGPVTDTEPSNFKVWCTDSEVDFLELIEYGDDTCLSACEDGARSDIYLDIKGLRALVGGLQARIKAVSELVDEPAGPRRIVPDLDAKTLQAWAWTHGRDDVARELLKNEGAMVLLDRLKGDLDPIVERTLRVELTARGLALLTRERELGGPLDVGEALRVAHAATDAARFEATVAHSVLKRIVDAKDGPHDDGPEEECGTCTAFEAAIIAAREIVGGAS